MALPSQTVGLFLTRIVKYPEYYFDNAPLFVKRLFSDKFKKGS
jgi:hypothetical protein